MKSVAVYGVRRRLEPGWRILAILAVLVAAVPVALRAQDASADEREAALDALAAEVGAELRCPVCRNQSVIESSAELSREMQATIRAKLAAGESPEEVKAYFVSRYGEWILLKPSARGVNMAVYALPALVLLLGGAFLLARLKGWARKGSVEPDAPLEGVSEEDERWLEDAIRRS